MLKHRIRRAQENGADEGFTLIELLIVIVVLGVLAGIVVFGVAQFRTDAGLAACKADLKTVQTASDAFFAQNQPSHAASIAALVTAGYLKAAPAATSGLSYNSGTGAVTSSVANCTI